MVWDGGGGGGGWVGGLGWGRVVGVGRGGGIVVFSDQKGGFEDPCLDGLELYVLGVGCTEGFVGGEKGGMEFAADGHPFCGF